MLWLIRFATSPLGRYIVAALALLVIVAGIYYKGKSAGEKDALTGVQKQNDKAIKEADKAARTVDDCYQSGGVWDRATGNCRR